MNSHQYIAIAVIIWYFIVRRYVFSLLEPTHKVDKVLVSLLAIPATLLSALLAFIAIILLMGY